MTATDQGTTSPLAAVIDRYLRHVTVERGLSANTVAAYRRDLERYRLFLEERGTTDPAGVRSTDVSAFSGALRGEGALTASSTARMLSSVRSLHRFLLEEGLVGEDVAREVKPPKLASRLPKAITIEQMERLLAATEGDDPLAIRDHALLELLYATGARISEVVGLNVDDVMSLGEDGSVDDGEDDTLPGDMIRVTGKGDKQRLVPVGRFARTALDAYLVRVRPALSGQGRPTPALFLGRRGSRMSRQNAWLIIRAAAERAGLEVEISPHTFRHSFATHLLAGGADVRVVQELLGHSSVATTQIYTLVTADTLRDMYTTSHPRARG
ncbi:site-specific tyrosine recombinase XerD [Microbacteriaceae bacterium 4G12]